jgi:CRP-like cAMP-binding protein
MRMLKEIIDEYIILTDESFKALSKLVIKKNYHKKDFLIKDKKDFNKFFILTDGIARSATLDDDGKKRTRDIFQPPWIFTSLKNNIQKDDFFFSIEFDCLTDVIVYEGDFLKLKEILPKYPDLVQLYIRCLETTLLKFIDNAAMFAHLDATERYLSLKKKIPNIENLIQLNHIANYLNITPVQFSRIRKKIYSI